MADNSEKKVIIDVSVNGGEQVAEVNNQVKDLNSNINKTGKTDLGTNQIKSFKQQLKEATAQALALQQAGKENTAEYKRAVATIAELKDQQDVLNRSIQTFDPGNKFQALSKFAATGAQAIGGITGAIELMGLSSSTAEEAIKKMMAIQQVVAMIDAIGDLQDFYKAYILRLKEGTAAKAGDVAVTEAQTVATEAQTVATKGATAATVTLRTALSALGIGLIVSALAYLITNFDEVKKYVVQLIPALGDMGKSWEKIKQVLFGVGNTILQFIVAPIKSVIALVKGDFKGALSELANGIDITKNYNAGVNNEIKRQNEQHRKEELEKLNKNLQDKVDLYKAYGKDTYSIEREILNNKLKIYDKDTDEYKQALKDRQLLDAAHTKKLQDEAKKRSDEAERKRKEEAEKLKAFQKELEAFTQEANGTILSDFEKNAIAINQRADELLAKATTQQQKNKIEQNRAYLLTRNSDLSNSTTGSINADTALTKAEDQNRPSENDSPDEAKAKIDAISKAKIDAENAAFEVKRLQKIGQDEELRKLEAEHQKNVTDIQEANSKARAAIDEAEKEAKLANLATLSSALGSLGQLAGENTIAGKSLAIAQATIDTYTGANKAIAQGGIWGAISAAGIIAAGLANVKKIVSTKVPNTSNSSTGTPSFSAPVINSTVLQQQQNGTQDIVNAVQNQNTNIRAYIVDKDLQKREDKNKFLNSQSTI